MEHQCFYRTTVIHNLKFKSISSLLSRIPLHHDKKKWTIFQSCRLSLFGVCCHERWKCHKLVSGAAINQTGMTAQRNRKRNRCRETKVRGFQIHVGFKSILFSCWISSERFQANLFLRAYKNFTEVYSHQKWLRCKFPENSTLCTFPEIGKGAF